MCGIAGVVISSPWPAWADHLARFSQALIHRGPDDVGFLLVGRETYRGRGINSLNDFRIGLAHRRLAIIDLFETGWQPMESSNGRYHIVFNGEIYNYLELRRTLEANGHIFLSTSDTEVLLSAWVEWGPSCLKRFVGMFAFALIDNQEEVLYLVRDFFGIKPLYYTHFQKGIAFASEIPALLDLPGVNRRVNPNRIYRYLRFGLTDDGDETLFADVFQVPAAHYLKVDMKDLCRLERVRYWKIELKETMSLGFKEASERLRTLFLESVRVHLRSDVPVGAALSGGIDSSSIVAAIRHLEPGLELHTFSFVVDNDPISEEQYVQIAAQATKAHVHKVRITPEELIADLDHLIRVQGEPFGSTSIYAQYRVFRLAREAGVKVMLDGQGADELLAGYIPYGAARVASLAADRRWGEAISLLQSLSRLPGREPIWFQVVAKLLPADFYPVARVLSRNNLIPSWLNRDWFTERGVKIQRPSRLDGWFNERLRKELVEALTETSLPMLLRYEDRNSMAHSIESRVPFLTPVFEEFVLNLPEEYLIATDGVNKAVFRSAMRGLVPDAILGRKDKIGFATPELRWLRALTPWVERQLQDDILHSIQALRASGVRMEWQRVLQGKRRFDFRVWRWINLIAWTRAFEVEFN